MTSTFVRGQCDDYCGVAPTKGFDVQPCVSILIADGRGESRSIDLATQEAKELATAIAQAAHSIEQDEAAWFKQNYAVDEE